MKRVLTIVVLLGTASVAPLIFPIAESGRSTMDVLAKFALLPSIVLMLLALAWVRRADRALARLVIVGLASGAVATLGLEAVRLTGYRLGFMPGNLPRLMGVLLLNQFAAGPTLLSDLAGWGYHFWNGASFGLIYVLLLGTCRRWLGVIFGLALGLGFMLSPVVSALGVGFLGLSFSTGFPITVSLAHAAFGAILGWLAARWAGFVESPAREAVGKCSRNWLSAGHLAQRARSL